MEQVCYSDVRGLIQGGDLIEVAGQAMVAKTIRWKTGAFVNHTTMAVWQEPKVKPGDNQDHLDDRLYVIEAISNGVRLTPLSSYVETYKGKIYWAPLEQRFDAQRALVLSNMRALEGIPYGWKDLVTQLRHRTPLDAKRLFCSEAAQLAFVRAGVLAADYTPTGMAKHSGCGLWPGEFQAAGVCQEHKELRVK